MDSVAVVLTAWLGLGACGFTAGAVGVEVARRRIVGIVSPRPARNDELVTSGWSVQQS